MQPDKFGRYEIIEELGRGAMGQVWLAHDPEIDRKVAIKTVQIFAALPEHERAEARERFLREARSAGRLLHPGIVTLFDVGDADGALYLAMEYVQGTTLDHYCHEDTRLPIAEAVELVARAAEALAYAHDADIVHRDIKPANLMHVGDAAVKIMDFGLAKPSEAQLTQDGALLGTPSYMSPEQIRGERLDGRSDLFSLAVVLYELLTGHRPFGGDSISSIIYRIVNEDPRDIAAFGERIPPPLASFLRRALAKDADERFTDGREFAAELRLALSGLESAGDTVAGGAGRMAKAEAELPPPETTRPRRSSFLPFIVVLLLLAAAAGGAGWYFREDLGLTSSGPPPEQWFEARVRVEPAGARVTLDGEPLDPSMAGVVRFKPDGPPRVVEAELACRAGRHELTPADAGGEVAIVLDPLEMNGTVDPGVAGARVQLNGTAVGEAPAAVDLDLCGENRIRVEADGYYPAEQTIPAGSSPLDARTALASIEMKPIPVGKLVLPSTTTDVVYYVDGDRAGSKPGEVELTEGKHRLRLVNDTYWIDVSTEVEVRGGATTTPKVNLPAITTLVVQAFPPNCKVFVRRPGGSWKYLDDTPMRTKIASGRYEVRVKLNPTGEIRDQTIDLSPGENPPVRVSFGRG